MTGHLLPIIDGLADAADDGLRGRWLLSCPLAILVAHEDAIRGELQKADFPAGVDYLDYITNICRSTRTDGEFSQAAREILSYANDRMRAVIAAAEGAHAGE